MANANLYYDIRNDLIDIDCSIQLYGTVDRTLQNASPGCIRGLDLLEFIYKTDIFDSDLLKQKVIACTTHPGCNNDEMLAPCTLKQAWQWTNIMAIKFKQDEIAKFSAEML